jgi:hypothetical protein
MKVLNIKQDKSMQNEKIEQIFKEIKILRAEINIKLDLSLKSFLLEKDQTNEMLEKIYHHLN